MSVPLTYEQRNALATLPAAVNLTIADLTLPNRPSAFAALEAAAMGAYGTAKDGYDGMFAPLLAAVPLHSEQTAEMDTHLAGAAFVPGEIAATVHKPVSDAIAALVPVGDSLLYSYALMTGTPYTPGSSGGSGGGHGPGGPGGGGGGAGDPNCGRDSGGMKSADGVHLENRIGPCASQDEQVRSFTTVIKGVPLPVGKISLKKAKG
jgi:hypothetical protein